MTSEKDIQSESNLSFSGKDKRQINISRLNQLVAHWRCKYLQQQLLLFMPILCVLIITLLFTLMSFNFFSVEYAFIVCLLALVLTIVIKLVTIIQNKQYASITLKNLITHLNSQFEELEQSTQLLLVDQDKLSALEKLQQNKVLDRLAEILQQQAEVKNSQLSPDFAKQEFIFSSVLLFILLIVFIISYQFNLVDKIISGFQPATQSTDSLNNIENKPNDTAIKIIAKQVTIMPPSYSLTKGQAAKLISESLDINTLVGSKVRWRLNFSAPKADYFLVLSNSERHQLIKQDDGSYQIELILRKSMVYHIAARHVESKIIDSISGIHRMSLTPDYAPKIRFINPKSTVTEYGKNTLPNLTAEVQISDDFSITDVQIKASIAKGSGEGVKFRDQIYAFDSDELVDGKRHYYKKWSIAELAMEPGDELYFSIVATDNREPDFQQTRSTTKIIRWLEEEQSGINADGILIDFMPKYFKSQRQIIIETIELIEDKTDLEPTSFNEKSELLGVAQSALKEKYGQYLGDEVEGDKNNKVSLDEAHDTAEHKPEIKIHDEQGGSVNAVISSNQAEHHEDILGHLHESEGGNNTRGIQASGRMELINQYGHNHEDSDVGVMTNRDPRALMKQSLSHMWQAELHLMLSEPSLALPFEQQALKLLNLARKAERIYVKRLGFEPPPVTEQRRYQGDQTDILANSVQVSRFMPEQLSNQTLFAFRQFLQLLNAYNQPLISSKPVSQTMTLSNDNGINESQNFKANVALSVDELALVELTKLGIEELIDERPALVELLVVIEKILLERRLSLSQCAGCIELLSGKLEQLLPSPTSSPNSKPQDFNVHQSMVENYSQFLTGDL
ncbi:hypothetical protein [Colwellia sp. Arc7-D]|uniref:hypothetical protein n=1 Tax=Colwellia sp. Arc7-D TaxID=2161872 RepID=UPI000D355C6A|nr:hypothetical protein [Colwellia sp. Arc7-D]AWB57509.1 hypothetical protein DBO93_08045 [Colwellia sp. Arc7-D]